MRSRTAPVASSHIADKLILPSSELRARQMPQHRPRPVHHVLIAYPEVLCATGCGAVGDGTLTAASAGVGSRLLPSSIHPARSWSVCSLLPLLGCMSRFTMIAGAASTPETIAQTTSGHRITAAVSLPRRQPVLWVRVRPDPPQMQATCGYPLHPSVGQRLSLGSWRRR